jgi:hypothetical protein
MSESMETEARNETIFREMNEWTEEATDEGPGKRAPQQWFLCECSDRNCTEPISLTHAEYESIRSEPVRFAIALNHENPELERVLFENHRFAAVEKFFGVGAKIARATDPRR